MLGGSAQDAKHAGQPRGAHMLGTDLGQGDGLRRVAIRNSYDTRSRCPTPHPHTGSFLPTIALPLSPGRPRSPVGTATGRYSAGSKIITSTVDSLLPSPWKLNGMSHGRAGRRSCSRTQSQNHLNRLRLHPSFTSSASCPAEEPSPGRLHRRGSFSESNIAARCRSKAVDKLTSRTTGAYEELDGCGRPLTPAPPCSTTSLDFHRHPKAVFHEAGPLSAGSWLRRCATPRGNNPHPVGLVFQSPYNRHGKVRRVAQQNSTSVEVLLFSLSIQQYAISKWFELFPAHKKQLKRSRNHDNFYIAYSSYKFHWLMRDHDPDTIWCH